MQTKRSKYDLGGTCIIIWGYMHHHLGVHASSFGGTCIMGVHASLFGGTCIIIPLVFLCTKYVFTTISDTCKCLYIELYIELYIYIYI